MTLRHKNNKWFQHIKHRGLDKQDEGTLAAVKELGQIRSELTRKQHSMYNSSSSSEDTSDDDDDENTVDSDLDKANKLLIKAKQKTMKVLEEDEEIPQSGLLSLPFMVVIYSSSLVILFS